MSKIGPEGALAIRSAHQDGGASVAALAKHYGVHPSVIENVIAGKTFRGADCFPVEAAP